MPSRFALHGERPSLIHGLCAFFRLLLTPLSTAPSSPPSQFTVCIGKIQRGAHPRGLKPQIFRENRGVIFPGKSGLFGANWRHFRAGRGLFGADRDQSLCTPQPRGKSRNCPERARFGPIGPFRAKPPFVKPPFGFPDQCTSRFARLRR